MYQVDQPATTPNIIIIALHSQSIITIVTDHPFGPKYLELNLSNH